MRSFLGCSGDPSVEEPEPVVANPRLVQQKGSQPIIASCPHMS